MKKLICVLTAVLCCAACFVPCFAAIDVYFTLQAFQQPGENVKLSVNISKDSALYTTEFFITYDENTLEFIENKSDTGTITAELNPYFSATKVSDGKIKVSYTSAKPLDSAGELCSLEFRAKSNTYTEFKADIDHAETFDGEHIRSLSVQTSPTSINIVKQFYLGTGALIAIIAAVCAVTVSVVIFIKKKKRR